MNDPMSTNDMFAWIAFSLAISSSLLLILLLHSRLSRRNQTNSSRLPPGPPGWPLIGYLLNLSYQPHKTFVHLQKKYGPVFMLRLGAMNVLVIASEDAAMELFKHHDQAFSNRLLGEVLKLTGDEYGPTPLLSPSGSIWRMNRRLYAAIFSRTTLKKSLGRRRQFVDQMMQWISVEEKEGRSVEIRHLSFVALTNLFGNLFFSKDLMDFKSATGNELYHLIKEIGVLSTKPNVADFFPWLRKLDPQNLGNRMNKARNAFENIIDEFVKERKGRDIVSPNNNEEKDFLDMLMDFEGSGKDEPKKMLDKHINAFMMEMMMGGTDTTVSTIEWVMTEVVRNPEVMRKAKDEIAQVVGYNRKIEESDTGSLPYLGAVIKEAMRLNPVAPFLIPRATVEETEFMGYIVPKDTAVFVNIWGIGRDSASWDDPFSFNPDRFLGNTTDYRGRHYRFLPFGAGRRICPGLPMVNQILPIVVGSLLQSFDWTLENGVTPESIDMNEKLEMSLKKSTPLRIKPRATALQTSVE
ncbi:hypothetical protein C5167_026553 [Papaver somniferum]|uniref:cytochrome P450 76A2-like n=1 Tax=Papaver somniferum TaxID=3469 RepID=UPI000E7043C8|nr:cytochrome P450 76A2-like [Papaver somniferum]RZC85879.1 hypothetical protein C5167_026553 [Papaver somniferum]